MIYAITCFEKLEEVNTWPDFGCTAFMGYYEDFDEADEAVRSNACDINEHVYNYAAIEAISPGLYAYPRERWLYKFENEGYVRIEEPKFMGHIANIL